jgi:peroxiredoxin
MVIAMCALGVTLGCRDDRSVGIVTVSDANELRRELEKYRGRVVVLDAWATGCAPCVEAMPWFQRLHETMKPRVAVIGLCQDSEEDIDKRVRPFLHKHGVAFPQLLAVPTDYGAFVAAIHPDWGGGMPATFVFDKNGQLARAFLDTESNRGKFFLDLRETIDKLLAEKPASR